MYNMQYYSALLLCVLVEISWSSNEHRDTYPSNLKFPPLFKFGSATSSHQIEGAWNISDKSPSIWDVYAHGKPELIVDGSDGDVACDSYHLWRQDVRIASELGLHFYRFSIAWSRLLPSGFPNHISEDGKNYYSNLIDGLLAEGIEPVVTIYHFDLPQSLQDLGGWTNPLISDWFADYSRVVYTLYGNRVKTWITLNEPLIFCDASYSLGAAQIVSPDIGSYLCKKHVLVAHAKAWRIYDREFRHKYHGKVSLTNILIWFESDEGVDEEAVELARQYGAGMYSHPIYSKEGGWPPMIERLIAKRSREEGYPQSRLPAFTKDEIKLIRGTYDFYGFNYYTSRLARWAKPGEEIGPWPFFGAPDLNITFTVKPEWKKAPPSWFYIYPEGIRRQMKWLKDEYGDMEIFVTENGVANYDDKLHDLDRVEFYKKHLEQVLLSIYEDNVRVTAFTTWTLMDDFEWIDGYHSKFGLYAVDFKDPQRKRTPRSSAYYYANVIKNHSLMIPPTYSPYTQDASEKNSSSYMALVLSFVLVIFFSY